MTNTALDVRKLTVGYGRVPVVSDINLTIGSGEFLAIVGPNGSGKSTLLKGLVGLAQPISGEVWLGGTRLDGMSPQAIVRHGMALVPQGHPAFPSMTVVENLYIPALGMNRKARTQAVQGVFSIFPQLAARKRQRAGTLSGGEMQMLSVARALITDPDVILFDEPSIGLAPRLVDSVFQSISQLRSTGKSVVLVEQKARRALEMADRALVLRLGKPAALQSASELLMDGRLERIYLGHGDE